MKRAFSQNVCLNCKTPWGSEGPKGAFLRLAHCAFLSCLSVQLECLPILLQTSKADPADPRTLLENAVGTLPQVSPAACVLCGGVSPPVFTLHIPGPSAELGRNTYLKELSRDRQSVCAFRLVTPGLSAVIWLLVRPRHVSSFFD